MDIKSTGSKKFSFIIAAALIMTAVLGYRMMYPVFEKQAANYDVDTLRSQDFLYKLYDGSCVLYKDITEAVTGEKAEYADLYLKTEDALVSKVEEEVLEGLADTEFWEETYGGIGSFGQMSRERIANLFSVLREEMQNGLAQEMDYCVIDNLTGKKIKNTGRELEKLATQEADEKLNDTYAYYVKVSYDNAGNLEHVAVKGKNPDELLKSAQVVMKSSRIWSLFWSGINYDAVYADGSIYYHDSDNNIRKETVTVSSTPRNTTYIFALTYEQQETLLNGAKSSNMVQTKGWEEWYSYYSAGTVDILRIFLCVLAVFALILPRTKKYCLHTLSGVKLHAEVSIVAIIIWFSGVENIVSLVNYTNRGYFNEVYLRYVPYLPESIYPVVTELINVIVLFFVFGMWYYLVTSLGEASVLGIREFLRERSLIRKCWLGMTGYCKGKANKFKEEILHVDLGEKADKTIRKLVFINFIFLAAVCCMWMFGWAALVIYSIVLYFALKKYIQKIQQQYRKLFDATRSIANGNLQTEFDKDWGIFESYKEELSKIQDGFKAAVEEEVKSQRMKTELITNVSHDLKTPLTAITTYVELLEEEAITQEQRKEYLDVLKRKSARLKFLIEDLFEVSKASSGNITLNPVDVDICNLMRQVYLEYEDKVEEADLIFRFQLPEEKVILQLDSQKTYRVFENLYINIIKYAMPHTRVYVNAEKTEKGICIELKNISAAELNIVPEDLTERFVRGDSSRNTEGSGLGLAIARSFVELQGGRMRVEIDGDLFKVTISW